MPDGKLISHQVIEPDGTPQRLVTTTDGYQRVEQTIREQADTPLDLLAAWTSPALWSRFEFRLPKPKKDGRVSEDARKSVWGVAAILIRDAAHDHKARYMLTPKRSFEAWEQQTGMDRGGVWKALQVLAAMGLLGESTTGHHYRCYFSAGLARADDVDHGQQLPLPHVGTPNIPRSSGAEMFGTPNIDVRHAGAGMPAPACQRRHAEHSPGALRSAGAPASDPDQFRSDQFKPRPDLTPGRLGALRAREAPAPGSDRIGLDRVRASRSDWAEPDAAADAVFVAALRDPASVAVVCAESIDHGLIDASFDHRLKLFTFAVHAATFQPQSFKPDATIRRKTFWKCVWGLKQPTSDRLKVIRCALTNANEREAEAMIKRIDGTAGERRTASTADVIAEAAVADRPPRPAMSREAQLAVEAQDWCADRKLPADGRVAATRCGMDVETYRRHLAEADAAIEAWQLAGSGGEA